MSLLDLRISRINITIIFTNTVGYTCNYCRKVGRNPIQRSLLSMSMSPHPHDIVSLYPHFLRFATKSKTVPGYFLRVFNSPDQIV